jgi:hypothetical protein
MATSPTFILFFSSRSVINVLIRSTHPSYQFFSGEKRKSHFQHRVLFLVLEPDRGAGEEFDDSETDGSIISESDTRVNLAVRGIGMLMCLSFTVHRI